MLRWIGNSIVPVITHPVEHGDVLELADREWFVVHTPGHTSDHFCLHDPEHGTFLAGDHVLPTITPHISGISSSPDPLSSFFYSLDRVAEIAGVRQVLPAHGHPFSDLRARTEAIKRHHHERLEKVKAISKRIGPASVEAFSHELFNPRSWGSMAESETYAHLEHLRIAGQAERHVAADGKLDLPDGLTRARSHHEHSRCVLIGTGRNLSHLRCHHGTGSISSGSVSARASACTWLPRR